MPSFLMTYYLYKPEYSAVAGIKCKEAIIMHKGDGIQSDSKLWVVQWLSCTPPISNQLFLNMSGIIFFIATKLLGHALAIWTYLFNRTIGHIYLA